MKLVGGRFRTDERKYYCTQTMIKMWNSLPEDIVMTNGINSFKKNIRKIYGGCLSMATSSRGTKPLNP